MYAEHICIFRSTQNGETLLFCGVVFQRNCRVRCCGVRPHTVGGRILHRAQGNNFLIILQYFLIRNFSKALLTPQKFWLSCDYRFFISRAYTPHPFLKKKKKKNFTFPYFYSSQGKFYF